MVDGGAGLNLCTLKLIKALGILEAFVDTTKSIFIKAYDDEERKSKGVVTLPIRIGPALMETKFQVLDLTLPYNLMLGRQWIHAMKAVPSTYHQCLKFPYNGTEITIDGDPDPFQYHTKLKQIPQRQVPVNQEASSSNLSSYVDPSTLTRTSISPSIPTNLRVEIQDKGCGEYYMKTSYCVSHLVPPKSYGLPTTGRGQSIITIHVPPTTTFTKWGELSKEAVDTEDVTSWLYKEDNQEPLLLAHIPTRLYGKGFKIMQSKGYDGQSGLGLNQDGRVEPIFVSQWPKGVGLGFQPIQIGVPSTSLPLLEEVHASEDI